MQKWAENDADNTNKIENVLVYVNGYHRICDNKTAKCDKVGLIDFTGTYRF